MSNGKYCINYHLNEFAKNTWNKFEENDVNFIHLLQDANKNEKVSIIGEYVDVRAYTTNEKKTDDINDAGYYGLSPLISAEVILEGLKGNFFKSLNQLNTFMQEIKKEMRRKGINAPVFNLRENEFFVLSSCKEEYKRDDPTIIKQIKTKYEEALFAKTLVKMATNFGVKFEIDNCSNEINEFLAESNKSFVNNVNYKSSAPVVQPEDAVNNRKPHKKNGNDFFILLGNPSAEMIDELNKKFVVLSNKGTLKISLLKGCDANAIQFKKFVSNDYLNHLALLGSVYYSGVMPKLLKIVPFYDVLSNGKVKIIKLIFCKTTFATLDAFDSSYIKKHPLLSIYKKEIDNIDRFEDEQLKTMLVGISNNKDDEKLIELINNYLNCSLNSNTIAVSADIVTSDDYHIYVERNTKSIDNNTIYCSANGQSEIYDKNVSFYNNSVYEDCPTINIDKVGRIDFDKELERETFAELGVEPIGKNWEYYGISVLGINNSDIDSDKINYRRLHFNILAKNKTAKTLLEVEKEMKNATEGFENRAIYGMNLTLVNSNWEMFKYFLSFFSKVMLKMKDWIMPIFAILVFVFSFNKGNADPLAKIEALIKQSFSVLLFLITIKDAVISFKNIIARKRISVSIRKKITSIGDNTKVEQCLNKVDRFYVNHKTKMHPIAKLMMLLSINDKSGGDKH